MSYTAIILDNPSHLKAWSKALELKLLRAGWDEKCHHVTLAMGHLSGYKKEKRDLLVTHYGEKDGRVTAFRVLGAGDSKNRFPHLTIAVAPDAKPVESNEIDRWIEIPPFEISGTVEFCR